MIYRIAEYQVKEGEVEVCLEAIGKFLEGIEAGEPGTMVYEAFRKPDGVSFIHFMAFEDEEAEEVHRNTDHVRAFVEVLYPRCEVEPVFTSLTAVAGVRR